MLELFDVHKSYQVGNRRFEVIRGVSLTVHDGEFIVLLGPSGSGKSTLLSLMSGLEGADSGTIRWNQEDLSKMGDKERTLFRRRHVGFVFQQYALLPELTVDKNVRLGADLVGNTQYAGAIDSVGLSALATVRCSQLSGGEQQRTAIARAVSKKAELLFLDEPTGALDEETGREVLHYLEQLHRQSGFAMIMVTHNPHIAEMADRIVSMNNGMITAICSNPKRKTALEIGW